MSIRFASINQAKIKAILTLVIPLCFMVAISTVAWAADIATANAYLTAFITEIKQDFGIIQKLAMPASVIALCCAAFLFFGNERNMEKGMSVIKYTVIALFCIWVFPAAVSEFASAINSAGLAWNPAHLVPTATPGPT